MLTQPNTEGREREVDEFLSGIRSALISGDFSEVEITYPTTEIVGDDGFTERRRTGGFTLTAIPK